MQSWRWLYNPATPFNWRFVRNVVLKAALLFVVLNLLFALLNPITLLGRISAYNAFFRGRERLPYGENPDVAYNLSLFQLDAMFASHALAESAPDNEYRVVLIGDSSVWGVLLEPEDNLAGQINAGNYRTTDERQVRAYNLGYPTMSLTKDLMLLEYALRYQPDLIVWLFTLESFGQQTQLDSEIVQHNLDRVQPLITRYNLNQLLDDPRLVELSFWDKTLVRQRRTLADVFRLQYYGVPWTVTGIDQEYRTDYTPRAVDLTDDDTWQGYVPQTFSGDDLAFDVLHAGVELAGDTPIMLINEPMLISDGANSDLRYNFFFPRWAYDEYRRLLAEQRDLHNWTVLDLWDLLPQAACYTDSAVHLTPTCSAQLGRAVGTAIIQQADTGTLASAR